jgi:ferredoxin
MARKAFIEHGIGKPPKFIRRGLEGQHYFFKLSKLPFVGQRHPWIRPDKTDVRWLPINTDIERPENTPLPITLLDRLIEEASHRVIVYNCGCRTGFECKNYPSEIGCLHLGDGAMDIPRTVSREVSIEEAKQHAHRAINAGLVPIVGKAHVDDFIYGLPYTGTMMTVCFCCECCCITRFYKEVPEKYRDLSFKPMDGISVKVTGDCKACRKCEERCFINAIKVVNGQAVISGTCLACGRCALTCPENAITVTIDEDALDLTYDRIRKNVRYY